MSSTMLIRFFARVSFDEDFVVTRFTPVGQAYGETVGRGVDDGADVGDACVRLKNKCVCGQGRFPPPTYGESALAAFGDVYRPRNRELHVEIIRGGLFVIAAAAKSCETAMSASNRYFNTFFILSSSIIIFLFVRVL